MKVVFQGGPYDGEEYDFLRPPGDYLLSQVDETHFFLYQLVLEEGEYFYRAPG